MKGFTRLSFAALAALASSASINVEKRETPLSIKLSAAGNSEVTIAVTNNGAGTLNLLNKGTLMDETQPVEKVKMFSASK